MIWLTAAGWLLAASLALLTLDMRRRLERVARAEHELRGPLAAIALGVEQVRRGRAGAGIAGTLEAQMDRSRAGLADLTAALGRARPSRLRSHVSLERLARHTVAGWAGVAARGGRRLRVDWRAGPVTVAADRGRLAQALGNLLSNAIEHGDGEIELRGRQVGSVVRIEVADAGDAGGLARPAAHGPAPARPRHPGKDGPPPPDRGRGLKIASRAVEESGGSLELLTGLAGTTAVLELPLDDR